MIPEYCDFVIEDGKIWYSSCRLNGLFCQSVKDGIVEFMGFFPDEKMEQKDLYRRIFLVDKELVFVPFYAKNICVYHLEYKRFTNYGISNMRGGPGYISAVQEEDKIYIFPAYERKAVLFDVTKKKVTELDEFNLFFSQLSERNKQKFYWSGTENNGGWVYLAVVGSDQMIAYHLKNKKILSYRFGGEERLGSIAVYENSLYISILGQNHVLYWNPYTNEKKMISYRLSCECQERDYVDFPILKVFGENIYMYFGRYDILGKIPLFSDGEETVTILKKNLPAYTVKQKNENLFFLQNNGLALYRYNLEEEKGYLISAKWDIAKNTRQDVLFRNGMDVIVEEIESSNKDCIKLALQYEKNMLKGKRCCYIGKKIWNIIKQGDL